MQVFDDLFGGLIEFVYFCRRNWDILIFIYIIL